MHLQRDFVAHMGKELLERLRASGLIQFDQPEYVTEVILQVMLDELALEDRINDEVRKILEQHGEKMKQLRQALR